MAAQRIILDKMLKQWEEAVVYDAPDSSNEVHVAGDMNIDCWEGRWQEPNYSLVTLGRMVMQCCNSNNLSPGFSTRGETSTSCLDHVYCNAKYRMSKVKVLPFGGSIIHKILQSTKATLKDYQKKELQAFYQRRLY